MSPNKTETMKNSNITFVKNSMNYTDTMNTTNYVNWNNIFVFSLYIIIIYHIHSAYV